MSGRGGGGGGGRRRRLAEAAAADDGTNPSSSMPPPPPQPAPGGGRRQVRQRTSKDAAYALRLASGAVADVASDGTSRGKGTSGGSGRKRGRQPSSTSAQSPQPPSTMAQPPPKKKKKKGPKSGWSCPSCTLHNGARRKKCEACGSAKPQPAAATTNAAAASGSPTGTAEPLAGNTPVSASAAADDDSKKDGGGMDEKCATGTNQISNEQQSNGAAEAAATKASARPAQEPRKSSSESSRGRDGKSSSSRSRPRSSSSSSDISVTDWLRKRKGKGKGKSSSKRGRSSSGSSSRSRSRSPSPVSPAAAAATTTTTTTTTTASATTGADTQEDREGSHHLLEGIDPSDVKTVAVRVFDAKSGRSFSVISKVEQEEKDETERVELSDSGPLLARLLVGWPRFCATKKDDTPDKIEKIEEEGNGNANYGGEVQAGDGHVTHVDDNAAGTDHGVSIAESRQEGAVEDAAAADNEAAPTASPSHVPAAQNIVQEDDEARESHQGQNNDDEATGYDAHSSSKSSGVGTVYCDKKVEEEGASDPEGANNNVAAPFPAAPIPRNDMDAPNHEGVEEESRVAMVKISDTADISLLAQNSVAGDGEKDCGSETTDHMEPADNSHDVSASAEKALATSKNTRAFPAAEDSTVGQNQCSVTLRDQQGECSDQVNQVAPMEFSISTSVATKNGSHREDIAESAAFSASFVTFSAAGKKTEIAVSAEGLAKADKLLGGASVAPSLSASFTAFSPAGKETAIQVSEESLAKADQLFRRAPNPRAPVHPVTTSFSTSSTSAHFVGAGAISEVERGFDANQALNSSASSCFESFRGGAQEVVANGDLSLDEGPTRRKGCEDSGQEGIRKSPESCDRPPFQLTTEVKPATDDAANQDNSEIREGTYHDTIPSSSINPRQSRCFDADHNDCARTCDESNEMHQCDPDTTASQLSQQSDTSRNIFQPLTQAMPAFEYDYEMSQQQQEGASDPVPKPFEYCDYGVEEAERAIATTSNTASTAYAASKPDLSAAETQDVEVASDAVPSDRRTGEVESTGWEEAGHENSEETEILDGKQCSAGFGRAREGKGLVEDDSCPLPVSNASAAPILSATRAGVHDASVDDQILSRDPTSTNGSRTSALPASFSTFSTTGKETKIAVSEESLATADQILGTSTNGSRTSALPASFSTFSTTGKETKIAVSEESLATADQILGTSTNGSRTSVRPASLSTFSTIGKKTTIEVSKESLVKANEVLGSSSKVEASLESTSPSPLERTGAITATAMDSALSQVTAPGIHTGVVETNVNDHVGDSPLHNQNPSSSSTTMSGVVPLPSMPAQGLASFSAFSTAGKETKIAVSAESLAKAGAILGESSNRQIPTSAPASFASFSTVGQKRQITVSAESLARADQILGGPSAIDPASLRSEEKHSKELPKDKESSASDCLVASPKPPPSTATSLSLAHTVSFSTFSTTGKETNIAVSDEALSSANKFLGEATAPMPPVPAAPATALLSMAGRGSSIAVSQDAIAKTDKMLRDGSKQKQSLQFAETPSHTAPPRRKNRMSFGGATNASIAKHMHPAETPLPKVSRQTSRHLSTKKVLFRDDQGQGPHNNTGIKHEKNLDQSFQRFGSTEANITSTSAYTPKHTPHAGRTAAAVTRSTVRNPYARKPVAGSFNSGDHTNAVTPVPFGFNHVQGTFGGKTFSPKTLENAARLLEQPLKSSQSRPRAGYSADGVSKTSNALISSTARPRHLKLGKDDLQRRSGNDFHFAIDGTRLSLAQFDYSYGPMTKSYEECLERGVDAVILKLNCANATKLRFNEETGLPCAFFGSSEAPACKMVGSVQDLRRRLVSDGCNESLLVDKWIGNHFGIINWRLASTERRYPNALAGKYLTYEHVVSQLKERYEKELRQAKRPALRIILNRDASSGRMMILCVSQIHRFRAKGGGSTSNSSTSPMRSCREDLRLELTDGWYSVQAVLDEHLQSFVEGGKVKVGTKLLVAGAELVGTDDGVDPLDSSYSTSRSNCPVALKLTANATRRAKWDSKLGFVKPTSQIQSQDGLLLVRSLSDVIPGGGSIPLMDLIICRRFPRLYLEKLNGVSTILSEAQEERRRREFDERRHREMERISDAAEKECTKEVDELAPEIWKKMMASGAMCDFYEGLSRDDRAELDRWEERRCSMIGDRTRRLVDSKMQENVSLVRCSTPFLRLSVKALKSPPRRSQELGKDDEDTLVIPSHSTATLTVWRMSEDQCVSLKEGSVVRVKDLAVKSDLRDSNLQLSANDKTKMQLLTKQPSSRQLQFSGYAKRSFSPVARAHVLSRKASGSARKSSSVHMDFVGVLIRSEQENQDSSISSLAYFTDESGLLLRLQRDIDMKDESGIVAWKKVLEKDQVFAFKDVLVLPFDTNANCAVVSWSQPTMQEKTSSAPRIKLLHRWSQSEDAQKTIVATLASFDVGLPFLSRLASGTEIAIGYIFAVRCASPDDDLDGQYQHQYHSLVIAPDKFLVEIDCGSKSCELITAICPRSILIQTIEMHLDPFGQSGRALHLRDLLREGTGSVLAPSDMPKLNSLFVESGLLFQATLRRKFCNGADDKANALEILQITPTNTKALASLYLAASRTQSAEFR